MTRHMSRVALFCCGALVAGLVGRASGAGPKKQEGAAADLYMEIPIIGRIGEDAAPKGVETCLRLGSQNPRIKHVVFRIRSPGGKFEEAEEILDLVQSRGDRFRYHALVEEAVGAAVCLVVCCDTIHMTEGSIVGGGEVEPGNRISAALVARLGAVAQAKKHSFTLVRAMMTPDAQAHVWEDETGAVQIASLAPKDIPANKRILGHRSGSLLTLPRDHAVKAGLAKAGVEKAVGLGSALGLVGWWSAGNFAEGVMTRTRLNLKEEAKARTAEEDLLKRNTAQRRTLVAYMEQNRKEAMENDPARFVYEVDDDDEEGFTSASKRRWRERTQDSIEAWQRVRDAAAALVQLEQQAVQLGGKRIQPELNLSNTYSRCLREIERLESQRHRSGP